MKVVVVESPSKAKTINKYLGADYTVLASYGHIRDLPARNGSVQPDNNFVMEWELATRGSQQIKEIAAALKGAEILYLATDPDREGEAISWHVKEVLKEKKLLKDIPVKRVVFHEITKSAVTKAIANPRDLDEGLIQAYLARRALDYLVGFTLSPVLWRKLPGSKSAGRVQSVALRLVCEREGEIEKFQSVEYWSIEGTFVNANAQSFKAKLSVAAGEKLDKLTIKNAAQAEDLRTQIADLNYSITDVEKKQVKRHPTAPFTTSTLQQESHRKLRYGAKKTMQIAQKLYEGIVINGETVGLITYMRTDSTTVSQEALASMRHYIEGQLGKPYLHDSVRVFKSKSKNAQEAHEAIRPTQIDLTPAKLKPLLNDEQYKLYSLIWQRSIASQMSSALFDQVTINIAPPDQQYIFRTSGTTLVFDGFLKVYEESKDVEDDEQNSKLPILNVNENVDLNNLDCLQHFTQPPYRFTEASLVKKLEELGIGRPSTYASILSTLSERKYITIEKNTLTPQALGRLVTAFLENYFAKYVQYDFTAQLEDSLDDIANHTQDWHHILTDFWQTFKTTIDGTSHLKLTDVINQLNDQLSCFLFPGQADRKCPTCDDGQLSLKLGRFGSFIGCSNYPTCTYTHKLSGNAQDNTQENDGEDSTASAEGEIKKVNNQEPQVIGVDSESAESITLRKGPYGPYYQWGEAVGKIKPKRVPVPRGMNASDITMDQLMVLKSLPRVIGINPDTQEEISGSIGKFGPYLKYQGKFVSLKSVEQLLSITLIEAIGVLENAPAPKFKKSKK